jgi:alkylhydroperoxidase family enzyme
MSRLAGVADPGPDPLIKKAFERDLQRAGKIMQVTRIGVLHPAVFDAWSQYYEAVHALNGVDAALKSLVSLLLYMRVGCVMCLDFAVVVARMKGVPEEKIRHLQDYATADVFTQQERTVFRFADAIARNPAAVREELFEEIRKTYDDRQIMELIYHIATTDAAARISKPLELAPEGFSAGTYCPVPQTADS